MNLSDQVRQIIEVVAPTLGTALAGPLGGVAGTFIANKLGAKPNDTQAIESAVMSGSPDVMLKLKQADNEFKSHLADLQLSTDQLVTQDTANARAREIAVRDYIPAILAILVTLGFFGVLGYMLILGRPKENGDAFLVMLGALGTAWTAIITYYFGSSLSSRTKDVTIAAMAKG